MINLTKDIMIIKEGAELESAIKSAIKQAIICVQDTFFDGRIIDVEGITASTRNPLLKGAIAKFFLGYDDQKRAPAYDADWIRRLFSCSEKVPPIDIMASLIPTRSEGMDWLNRTYASRFKMDAQLLLHCIWIQGGVLLPMNMKLVTTRDKETKGNALEYAAYTYPETLALMRQPYMTHIDYGLPDIAQLIPDTAQKTFRHQAWRLIRATSWYQIEDIELNDAIAYIDQKLSNKMDYRYTVNPRTLLENIKQLFPERCKLDLRCLPNAVKTATKAAIEKGAFHVPEEIKELAECWLLFQERFIRLKKTSGTQNWKSYQKSLGILNSYLFETLPSKVGVEAVPMPGKFSRKHIEGYEGTPSFSAELRKGRSPATVKVHLYKIDSFLDYLADSSTANPSLAGFINPLSKLDFPYVKSPNGTTKDAFHSEHFVPLLQYCYAVEAFGNYLAEQVHFESFSFNKLASTLNKAFETEQLGFVPVVFLENPDFDHCKASASNNLRMTCIPLKWVPKFIIPLVTRKSNRDGATKLITYPQLNHIQQTIVALETGIRNIHIRWLDRRTYDQHIDRSQSLPPICNLWVNTDKANPPWIAKVSSDVIKLLDRQIKTHVWFDEPSIQTEAWYGHHEDNHFGKILTIFPRGYAVPGTDCMPGPLGDNSHRSNFKKTIFAFNVFCRYSLDIEPSNCMPEEFAMIESIDTMKEYIRAIGLHTKATKLIEHTPHSCRVTVVSEWIKILPPHIIGNYITGQSTVAHVIYYAKCDPEFLIRHQQYQKMALQNGYEWNEAQFSHNKAEDENSIIQQAFNKNRQQAAVDFGATSFDRDTDDGKILSGLNALTEQPLEALAFLPTHICPFSAHCPKDIVKDLGAVPGIRIPCGGCYYSVKTVDHLPRIVGHIRSLTETCAELEGYIKQSKAGGASRESLISKAAERKFLADEIIAWSVTVHCLEQMYQDIKTREHFLVQKPEIVAQRLEQIVVKENSLEGLLARIAEAKTYVEYFTPQLQSQVLAARNKMLAYTQDINRLIQDAPNGFTLIDEFRGLMRTTCETLGITMQELAHQIDRPMNLSPQHPQSKLKIIFDAEEAS